MNQAIHMAVMAYALTYRCLIPTRSMYGSQTVPYGPLMDDMQDYFRSIPGGPVHHFFGADVAEGARWLLKVEEDEIGEYPLCFEVKMDERPARPPMRIAVSLSTAVSNAEAAGREDMTWYLCLGVNET